MDGYGTMEETLTFCRHAGGLAVRGWNTSGVTMLLNLHSHDGTSRSLFVLAATAERVTQRKVPASMVTVQLRCVPLESRYHDYSV